MNVLVTGSFDLLHSGHIAFLKTAAKYGDVYVGIGPDHSIEVFKKRPPVNSEQERLFMVRSIKYVKWAWINSGIGYTDFIESAEMLMRFYVTFDIMIVNEDQDTPKKQEWCKKHNIKYIVLERKPEPGLPVRSSTKQRQYYD
jgi:cytidyltransferase-like protein